MIPVRDVIPTRTLPVVVLVVGAANVAALLYAATTAQPTAGFVVYLLFNILFLWLFGENVEDRTGHARFALLYAVCGLASAAVQTALASKVTATIAAAGGATAGVIGAYLVLYPKSRFVTLLPPVTPVPVAEVPAIYLVLVWFVLQGAAGTFWAHLTGLATGMAAILAVRRPERLRVEWWDPPAPRFGGSGVSARAR
jgi:membrane associated rhomboid family serine protease